MERSGGRNVGWAAWLGRTKQNLANEVADTCIVTGRANTLSGEGIALHLRLESLSLLTG